MNENMIEIEVCASSVESVIAAKEGGAKRVELCANLEKGGTTPPLSWIKISANISDLQIFTLIRPREGDFLYSENEFNAMKRDIIDCGEAKCDGVVIGILTEDGKVDIARCKELIEIAKSYNMSVTFHRAIDRSINIFDAMEDIISLGCDRILTSGGFPTAIEGKEILKKMIELAGDRIIIMPGSGINEDNIEELSDYLGVSEFHGSFTSIQKSRMKYINSTIDSFENECTFKISSSERIRAALNKVNKV